MARPLLEILLNSARITGMSPLTPGRSRVETQSVVDVGGKLMEFDLPDGLYPFIDQRLPLSDLTMIEMPADLEQLLRTQAEASGIEILRGSPVELRCQSAEFPDATFLVFWPHEEDRLHMLAPRKFGVGLA
jgi:hypothetical protein